MQEDLQLSPEAIVFLETEIQRNFRRSRRVEAVRGAIIAAVLALLAKGAGVYLDPPVSDKSSLPCNLGDLDCIDRREREFQEYIRDLGDELPPLKDVEEKNPPTPKSSPSHLPNGRSRQMFYPSAKVPV